LAEVVQAAEMIRTTETTERRQAGEMPAGRRFREQAAFAQYLARRAQDPAFAVESTSS
jgi:hypothetical protein